MGRAAMVAEVKEVDGRAVFGQGSTDAHPVIGHPQETVENDNRRTFAEYPRKEAHPVSSPQPAVPPSAIGSAVPNASFSFA